MVPSGNVACRIKGLVLPRAVRIRGLDNSDRILKLLGTLNERDYTGAAVKSRPIGGPGRDLLTYQVIGDVDRVGVPDPQGTVPPVRYAVIPKPIHVIDSQPMV